MPPAYQYVSWSRAYTYEGRTRRYPSFFFFFSHHFYVPAQLVGDLPSAIFWTSRGHRCRPFSPPVRAFNLYRAWGSAFPLLVDFHRMLLLITHALVLSANQFFMQEKFPTRYIYEKTMNECCVFYTIRSYYFEVFNTKYSGAKYLRVILRSISVAL